MSCKHFEMNIYVYDELSVEERNRLDIHLQTCSTCQALFQEVNQARQLIRLVAEEKAVPLNSAKLTGNIMSKITEPVKRTWAAWVSELLMSRSSKYSLSIVSSVLLIAFSIQSFNYSMPIKKSYVMPLANAVILNTKLFREHFYHSKEKHALFADCRSPFQSAKYYQDCIKNKLK